MDTLTDERLLAGLNPAQTAAVRHFEGPLLVLAGAGSGKTKVLTTRIARLIEQHGVDPARILAVTFTNKAAGEMRDRIAALLGAAPSGMWVGTFHSVGARLLRAHGPLVGRTHQFTIYDEDDQLAVVKRLMERAGVSPKQYAPKAVRAAISDAKNALVPPAEYTRLAMDAFTRAVAPVYEAMEPALRQANAVDFDDLLVLPVRMLEQHPDVLARLRARFQFLLVDEYQDTNRAQYRFVHLLGGEHANVCVVGDDDQSIYGWRGADIRNILDFEKDFPAAAVVRLEENYRSTPDILSVANAVIAPNTGRRGKTLRPTRPAGERVTVVGALDDRDEADFVVEELSARRRAAGYALRDFAVLYRTNAQSRALEEAMRRHGVPYRLVGAVRFYERREIRDLMGYLKLIANPADDEAFRRAVNVPKRGLGDTTVDQLGEMARAERTSMIDAAARPDLLAALRPAARTALADFARLIADFRDRAANASVDELLRDLVEATRYADALKAEGPEGEERLENVRELIAGAAETVEVEAGGEVGLTPLDQFLQRASLVADLDALDPYADAVTLMTLHNAKGLEFPVIFLTGLEDGLFPLSRAFDDPALLEEERRLLYVGVTRAEQKLFLTHARSRRRNGELLPSIPSSFLAAIPPQLVEQRPTLRLRATGRAVLPQTPAMRRPGAPVGGSLRRGGAPDTEAESSQDQPRFIKGERVRHKRFGSGTITELSGTGRETKVTVDFDDESVGTKRLVIAYAGLERGVD
jgi:DNA helicase-2/ATP-dependent DNA helicase PcrA